MVVKAYFIQYKFIFPTTIKHSSYTYQKLFRAIYGYNQIVYKNKGKKYVYYREGVLSKYPFLSSGKNCVIIPQNAFQPLQDFFKLGKNPTHLWKEKGEWKCTYFLNEKDLPKQDAAKAIELLLDRKIINKISNFNDEINNLFLFNELKRVVEKDYLDSNYKLKIFKEAQNIVNLEWFKEVYIFSPKLVEFYDLFKKLKENIN